MSTTQTPLLNNLRALLKSAEHLDIAARSIARAMREAAKAGWTQERWFTDATREVECCRNAIVRETRRICEPVGIETPTDAHAPDCDEKTRTINCANSGETCCACDPCNVCVGRG